MFECRVDLWIVKVFYSWERVISRRKYLKVSSSNDKSNKSLQLSKCIEKISEHVHDRRKLSRFSAYERAPLNAHTLDCLCSSIDVICHKTEEMHTTSIKILLLAKSTTAVRPVILCARSNEPPSDYMARINHFFGRTEPSSKRHWSQWHFARKPSYAFQTNRTSLFGISGPVVYHLFQQLRLSFGKIDSFCGICI